MWFPAPRFACFLLPLHRRFVHGQPTTTRGLFAAIVVLAAACLWPLVGCDRAPAPPATAPNARVTVASLVPAATDLLLGMDAHANLVGVSNFDQPRTETRDLPRVGDYRTIDWEKLAELRPAVMVVQFRPDKMPAGVEDHARAYGIKLVNVHINRLDDIYRTLTELGVAINEPAKAEAAVQKLKAQLNAVRARVAGKPAVRTLLSRTENPLECVGGGNFLDDLLTIAGGKNVLSGPGYDDNSYPTLDRELLLSLNPDAAINLLPGASQQVVEQAKQFWRSTSHIAAYTKGQVYYLTEDYLLWPGMNVGKIAERFAEVLHPEKAALAPSPPYAGERVGVRGGSGGDDGNAEREMLNAEWDKEAAIRLEGRAWFSVPHSAFRSPHSAFPRRLPHRPLTPTLSPAYRGEGAYAATSSAMAVAP